MSPANEHGNGWSTSASAQADLQRALDLLSSGGGRIDLGGGTFTISSTISIPDNVLVTGAGKGSTTLLAASGLTDPVLSFDGTASNHVSRGGLRDITVDGNGQTLATPKALVTCRYADRLSFNDVTFRNVDGMLLHTVEFWDSYFYGCRFDSSLDTGEPAVFLRSQDTGLVSSDSTNNIYFTSCVWETYYGGALWVDKNSGGAAPHGIFLVNCKMESGQNVADVLYWRDVAYAGITNLRAVDTEAAGATRNVFHFWGCFDLHVQGIVVTGNDGSKTDAIIYWNGGGWSTIDAINVNLANAPNNAMLETAGTVTELHTGQMTGSGAQLSGSLTNPQHVVAGMKAGAPVDGDFSATPRDGTLVYDTTGNALYIRDGGAWVLV